MEGVVSFSGKVRDLKPKLNHIDQLSTMDLEDEPIFVANMVLCTHPIRFQRTRHYYDSYYGGTEKEIVCVNCGEAW
jgi:hypothetical protein